MTKLKPLGGAIILLTSVVWGTAAAYDVTDISGLYGINTEGSVTLYDDSVPPQVVAVVPTTSVGLFNANGDGTANFVGTLNVGGVAIIPVVSTPANSNSATYTVEESGLGVIKAPVAAAGVPEFPLGQGALPPGFDLSGAAYYELQFVIIDSNNLDVIGTKFFNADSAGNPTTPIGALVISGSATKQAPDPTP